MGTLSSILLSCKGLEALVRVAAQLSITSEGNRAERLQGRWVRARTVAASRDIIMDFPKPEDKTSTNTSRGWGGGWQYIGRNPPSCADSLHQSQQGLTEPLLCASCCARSCDMAGSKAGWVPALTEPAVWLE